MRYDYPCLWQVVFENDFGWRLLSHRLTFASIIVLTEMAMAN
jgi:hypothetical protein